VRLLLGSVDLVGPADAALDEHPLQFGEVADGQRAVHPKLPDRGVILVLAQEGLSLGAELLEDPAGGEAGQLDLHLRPHLVLEVGKHDPALLLLNELGQIAKPTPHKLQHRNGHVDPPLVGLNFLDESHLGANHRDGRLLLEQAGDGLDPVAKTLEARRGPEQAQLQVEDQEIEPLRFFGLGVQLRRETGHALSQLAHVRAGQGRPGFAFGVSLHQPPLRPDEEVVEVHRGHFAV
jgi:hypothetical protein